MDLLRTFSLFAGLRQVRYASHNRLGCCAASRMGTRIASPANVPETLTVASTKNAPVASLILRPSRRDRLRGNRALRKPSGTDGSQTLRWREPDSNRRSHLGRQ